MGYCLSLGSRLQQILSCRESDTILEATVLGGDKSNGQENGMSEKTAIQGVKISQGLFEPGGIHRPEARAFWKNELQTRDWVMDTIENGYVIPLNNIPGK